MKFNLIKTIFIEYIDRHTYIIIKDVNVIFNAVIRYPQINIPQIY
jgi:hypothetical protein